MEEGEDEKKKEEGKPQAPIHKLKGKETKEDAREKKGKKSWTKRVRLKQPGDNSAARQDV